MRLSFSFALSLALALSAAGCTGAPTDDTPSGTVRLFQSAMEQSVDDRRGLEEAYQLLSLATRERLVERARQAAALGAAEREPWEMMVEGTAHMRFAPRAGGYREQPGDDPDHATVIVLGESGERVELPLVREEGGWRIVLDVPTSTSPSEGE